jgi:hypothetical protein
VSGKHDLAPTLARASKPYEPEFKPVTPSTLARRGSPGSIGMEDIRQTNETALQTGHQDMNLKAD